MQRVCYAEKLVVDTTPIGSPRVNYLAAIKV